MAPLVATVNMAPAVRVNPVAEALLNVQATPVVLLVPTAMVPLEAIVPDIVPDTNASAEPAVILKQNTIVVVDSSKCKVQTVNIDRFGCSRCHCP